MMLQALLLAALLLQDPKPAARTVEDRLKELDEKLSSLEKKQKTLADENATLEKQISDVKAAREKMARSSASAWVKRYAQAVEFTEKQAVELEELWYGWWKEDMEKPYDVARWKSREEILRGKLSAEQLPRLGRKVREEQEKSAKSSIAMFSQTARLTPEKVAALQKGALERLAFAEDLILPEAHPEKTGRWSRILGAVEASLPEVSSVLSDEEYAKLRTALSQWKTMHR